jgi:hypothetical protein
VHDVQRALDRLTEEGFVRTTPKVGRFAAERPAARVALRVGVSRASERRQPRRVVAVRRGDHGGVARHRAARWDQLPAVLRRGRARRQRGVSIAPARHARSPRRGHRLRVGAAPVARDALDGRTRSPAGHGRQQTPRHAGAGRGLRRVHQIARSTPCTPTAGAASR